jgi:hypothetical protein
MPLALPPDDPLLGFTSELPPEEKAVVAPAAVTAPTVTSDITAPAGHIQPSTVERHTATHLVPRSQLSKPPRLVDSLADYLRGLRARATSAHDVHMWIGRVRTLRPLRPSTALVSFACGTATGAMVMWFVGAHPPLTVAPAAIPALALEAPPPPPEVPTPPSNAQSAQAEIGAGSTLPPLSVVSATVGTSGLREDVAFVPAARRRNRSAPTYRGSLAFGSAPRGARVFVNGHLVGSTPLVLENLPVGSRAIRIEADGYQHWSSSTRVVANQQTHVSATLARTSR